MKRIRLALTCAVMLFVITGCGKEQVLECKLSANQSGAEMNQTMTLNFKNDKEISSASIDQDMILSEEYLENISLKDFKELITEEWEKGEYADFDYKVSDNGKDTVNLSVKMTAKDVEKKFGTSKNDSKIEDVKKVIETAGYTCTIK